MWARIQHFAQFSFYHQHQNVCNTKEILRGINFVKISKNIFQRWSRIWPLLFGFCAISTRLPEERMGVTKKIGTWNSTHVSFCISSLHWSFQSTVLKHADFYSVSGESALWNNSFPVTASLNHIYTDATNVFKSFECQKHRKTSDRLTPASISHCLFAVVLGWFKKEGDLKEKLKRNSTKVFFVKRCFSFASVVLLN